MSYNFIKFGITTLAVAAISTQCKEDEYHHGRGGIVAAGIEKALTSTTGIGIDVVLPTIISNLGNSPGRLFGQKLNNLDGIVAAQNVIITKSGSTKSKEFEYLSLASNTILFGKSPLLDNTGYHDASLVVNSLTDSVSALSDTVLGTIENAVYVASITAEPKNISTGVEFDTDQQFKIAAFHSKEMITLSAQFRSETGLAISSETEILVTGDQSGQMQFVALTESPSGMEGTFALESTWSLTDVGTTPGSATYDESGSSSSLSLCNEDLLDSFADAKNLKEIMKLVSENSTDISFNLIMANEVDLSKGKIEAKLNANRICQLYPVLIIIAEKFSAAPAGIEIDAGTIFIGHGEDTVDLNGVLTSSSPRASTDVHAQTIDILSD